MTFLWVGLLALLLLVVPLLLGVYAWSLRRRQPVGVRYSSLSLLRDVLPRTNALRRHLPFVLVLAAASALVVAMSRPAVVLGVPASRTNVILAMDVSGSMCSGDIPPSRMEVAQDAASDFVRRLPPGTQVGLVAFSGFAAVIQPPTTDRESVIDAIASLTTGRRTAIGSGILASIDALAEVDPSIERAEMPGRPGVGPVPVLPGTYAPAIIVVLTDGANNAGPLPVDAAQQAIDRGLRVYTIGYGTANGGEFSATCDLRFLGREPNQGGASMFGGGGGFPGGGGGRWRRGIDEPTLIAVAETTGGSYHPAESASELGTVFDALSSSVIMEHEVVEVSVAFVALAALLASLGLLLGRAWRPLP
jgi:Ca-activated chloride channel family protein